MATLESAITGAVASSLANIAVYPLDLAKTLVQTQLKEEHITKSSHNVAGKSQNGSDKKKRKDVITKEAELKYKNSIDCIVKVFKERGISGLYRGMSTSVLGNFIQSFCYFFWYTFVRRYYFKVKSSRAKKLGQTGRIGFSTIEELALGVVAGATSQLFTNPISVISTRQQTAEGTNESAALTSVIKQIYKEHQGNITGFWKGLKVSLVLCINPSITFASYQKLKAFLFSSEELFGGKNDELSALQNFILGVLSKMISTLITQPLIIAKASLQRTGSKFRSFQQVISYLYENEGLLALWKGIRPQLAKGIMVQGLLFMFKGELTKFLHRAIFLQSNVFLRRRLSGM
ncbi:hypothetical protein ZYGR_0AI02680 [Zygosaccharomyces rouxii]|uniref:Peroxisomal adenine nucleotide transporter 1 n=1 Tax=Zygosaccharomyces rouxii TaxID=4956 RepID=A0A1Q3AB55_ZYGRO|nr:hypothetical protein ZYGR_0AI02680 [Zygosaccharomyces rouxii]